MKVLCWNIDYRNRKFKGLSIHMGGNDLINLADALSSGNPDTIAKV